MLHDVPNIHNLEPVVVPAIDDATWPLKLVVSGGQTGVDQAALRAAKALGYRTGGMAPKGYRTDAGPAGWLASYNVQQHPTCASYGPRTWYNVRHSVGTVWFGNQDSPGYNLTKSYVQQLRRHWLVNPTITELRAWIRDKGITTLNVAGNRERTNPGIYLRTEQFLLEALRPPMKGMIDGEKA